MEDRGFEDGCHRKVEMAEGAGWKMDGWDMMDGAWVGGWGTTGGWTGVELEDGAVG